MKPLTPTQRLRPRECTAVGWGPDMCFNQLPKGLSSKTKSRKRSSTLGSSLLRPLRQKWLTHHAKVCAELHKLSCPLQAINGEPAWLIKLTPSTESPESRLWGGGQVPVCPQRLNQADFHSLTLPPSLVANKGTFG